jgi:hypothetical protein
VKKKPIINERCKLKMTIESLRKEMIRIGIQEGLTSERTIKISQEIDYYILKYQSIISPSKTI